MGKKSRRKRGDGNIPSGSPPPPSSAGTTTQVPAFYSSDGPSNEELNCLQTTSNSLQKKLDQLSQLAMSNDRANFVAQFVPLDLSKEDAEGYLQDLTSAPEADGQWANLASEITAIAQGKGVNKIEGDQIHNAIFFFEHPLLQGCDREVSFIRVNGEWRAEG